MTSGWLDGWLAATPQQPFVSHFLTAPLYNRDLTIGFGSVVRVAQLLLMLQEALPLMWMMIIADWGMDRHLSPYGRGPPHLFLFLVRKELQAGPCLSRYIEFYKPLG
jgi:hypothetical protein